MEAQDVFRQLLVLALMCGAAAMSTASPASASDRVVLVGCDLLSEPGPRALYRQFGGDSDSRSGFSFGTRDADVRGRSCSEVLAEVAAAGLNFKEFRIVGVDASVGVWFWKVQ
jgi:hypothetical protein